MGKLIDMSGRRVGRLVVIRRVENCIHNKPQWECVCDCGKLVTVKADRLQGKHTRSCGCLKIDLLVANVSTHGKSSTRTYATWEHMIDRCTNPNNKRYSDYGGRGIVVCERWRKFECFMQDMGERPDGCTLDRIDVNGNYEPSNCRWATPKEQQRNLRSNHLVDVNGEPVTISEAAELTGMNHEVIRSRLRRGWSTDESLARPVVSRMK